MFANMIDCHDQCRCSPSFAERSAMAFFLTGEVEYFAPILLFVNTHMPFHLGLDAAIVDLIIGSFQVFFCLSVFDLYFQ